MTVRPYMAGEAGLWVQPEGPNGALYYLGCHDVGDITEPMGDITLTYCPDPASVNKWQVTGSFQSEAGAVTTTITAVMQRGRDWLERALCQGPIYITKISAGRRDQFTHWERVFALVSPRQTERGISGLLARNPKDQAETTMTFNISAEELLRLARVTSGRQSTSATRNLLDVAICSTPRCKDRWNTAIEVAQYAVAVGAAAVGVPAVGISTDDAGSTWTAFSANPFANNENISTVVCFDLDPETTRWIVGRGTTDADNPAEIAYSDDGGATWTNVNVGSVTGQYVTSLFALDLSNIWLGTDDGYIYYSDDSGLTWTAQESGTLISGAVNGIFFADADTGMAVGDGDVILYTKDGGTTWSAVTATGSSDDITCVGYNGDGIWWVGTSGGELYYSNDDGETWSARAFAGSGSGEVVAVEFVNALVGFMVHNTATPVGRVLRTVNGGYNWETVDVPTNAGFNALAVADEHTAFVVGNASGGTSFILKVIEEA